MGFGGKNRSKAGRRPGIPHHPRARLNRGHWHTYTPAPMGGFEAFRVIADAATAAINHLLLGITQAMGLDASMAPRRVISVDPALEPLRCSCAAAVISDRSTKPDVLACTLPAGHSDWHQDANGTLWRADDEGGLTVQLPGKIEHITTEVRVTR